MKNLIMIVVLVCCTVAVTAQTKLPPVDKSPMDMSYYPNSYPVLKIQDKVTEPLIARVIYSRPQRNGRKVFGELLEYGQIWRLGANEASEIEFFKNVVIGGNKIKKGRYTLYCLPAADKWTIILNKDTDTWGSFKYDAAKDVMRTDVPVMMQSETLESFVMAFEKSNGGANLVIAWDNLRVNVPFSF